ncbi:nucleotide exchange factor GrpE [Aeromicrobium sp.]
MTAEEPEQVNPEQAEEATEPTESSEAPEASDAPSEPEAPAAQTAEEQLAERTADLQRLQAEYINYKRRVERDRVRVKAQGEAGVLRSLLTVLDDIGRAADHGELEGGFKAVADALQQAVKSHRLESFGVKGDEFDPRLHDAMFHAGESADVDVTTVDSVLRTGYRVGDEVIRHAQVSVIDPAGDVPAEEDPADDAPATETVEAPVTDEDRD